MSSGYCARGSDLHYEGIKELLMPLAFIPGQPDFFLKANFWKRIEKQNNAFFFYLYPFPFLLSPHSMGLAHKVKEVEKLTVLLRCMPGTEPYSTEGYRSGDVRENIRKGRNPTARSQSQFFPPLMIVMVR